MRPAGIVTLAICAPACAPSLVGADYPVAHNGDFDDLDDLDRRLTRVMAQDDVPGLSACIIKDAQVAWCGAYGWADWEDDRPAQLDTAFLLASVSKVVTTATVMTQVDAGTIDLDGSAADIAGFAVRHPSDYTVIRPRHLLTHTSGIRDNWDALEDVSVAGRDADRGLGEFLEGYLVEGGTWYEAEANFVSAGVDQKLRYSNVGSALAGLLAERAAGQPFDQLSEQTVLSPLGMDHAGWHLSDFEDTELARPHRGFSGDWRALRHPGFADYPNGQLRAPAQDVARFVAMVAGGGQLDGARVLAQESVAAMLRDQTGGIDPDQGLGFYRWDLDGQEVWGHNGGEVGTSTEVGLRADGAGFVVLTNTAASAQTLIAIERLLLETADTL